MHVAQVRFVPITPLVADTVLGHERTEAVGEGVDGGGTFTDLILVDEEAGRITVDKVPSTPDDLWVQILESEPPEMAHGTVELDDGRRVETLLGTHAFVEARGGADVSEHRSWKAYRAASG